MGENGARIRLSVRESISVDERGGGGGEKSKNEGDGDGGGRLSARSADRIDAILS